MKFKVGDKVKVRKDLKNGYYGICNLEDYQNDKVFTIETISIGEKSKYCYTLLEDEEEYFFREEMLIPVEEKEEIILKGVKKNHNNYVEYIIEAPQKNGYVCSYVGTNEIYIQYKQEILDDIEKEYLRAVIKPFRDKVKYIKKNHSNIGEYITICAIGEFVNFPYFKKGKMYKGMEVDKKYSLEELGL